MVKYVISREIYIDFLYLVVKPALLFTHMQM